MAEKLDEIGFRSSTTDADVWLRPASKSDGEEYYEYILTYVDDILCMSCNPEVPMEEIASKFSFKDKVTPPKNYLGAILDEKHINGKPCWTMSSVAYVKAAIENVRKKITKDGMKFPTKVTTPIDSTFIPELNSLLELDKEKITYYQELIGILRWATEIGRVDILTEASLLSAYQESPRRGQLEQLLHIFSYLDKRPKLTLYFDPDIPKMDMNMFQCNQKYYLEQYRDTEE